MSWEGFAQNFCGNGHFFCSDMEYGHEAKSCPSCGAPIALQNVVDDTNCDQVGIIPEHLLEAFLIQPARIENCNLGHRHIVEEARYRLPTSEELKKLRHYYDYRSGGHVLLWVDRE